MEWIIDRTPNEDGSYIVSIRFEKENSTFILKYIAYYLTKENKWYKYDPFDLTYKPKDLIEGYVTAWSEGDGVYMG